MKVQVADPALDRIEQVLTDLARYVATGDKRAALVRDDATISLPLPERNAEATIRLSAAKAWVKARRARNRALGADLFSDPAWSMLLDLYVNHHDSQSVSISSLSIGAEVPLTTGTRWVAMLEKSGLIRREADPFDRRRTLVMLTEAGLTRMHEALDRAVESNRALGVEHVGRGD